MIARVALAICLSLGLGPGLGQIAFSQDLTPRLAACGACHGADGNAGLRNTPSLAGQPVVFLENQMVLIREGMRDIPAMKGVLEGVSDAEIGALARHYAKQPVKRTAEPRNEARYAQGERLAQQTRCGTCHLPNYVGREQMPRLAGQREDYLLHSMREFAGNRAVGRDTLMAASLHGLSDADLVAIAHFLAWVTP